MSKITKILIIIVILFIGTTRLISNSKNEEINLIAKPIQTSLTQEVKIVHEGKDRKYLIDGLAKYEISAVVKSKKMYRWDGAAVVSPLDLVLVWGQLDDKEIGEHIKYRQMGRWYSFRYGAESHVTGEEIAINSANVHIIPKDKNILKIMKNIKKEDYVTLKGYLVNVRMTGGDWTSSLTREDTGDGACEIFYVEEVILN